LAKYIEQLQHILVAQTHIFPSIFFR